MNLNNIKLYYFFVYCFFVFAISCKAPLIIQQTSSNYIAVDSNQNKNNTLENFMHTYRIEKDKTMQTIIGEVVKPLSKTQPESSLGNFMVDAQLYYAKQKDEKVVAAVINYGSIRIPYISPGPITIGTIYELMPFDNTLVIAEVPGKIVKEFCDHMATLGGWPVANISFEIKDKKAHNILVNGKPIHEAFIYKIALSDYIANGGDNCEFLLACKKTTYPIFIRDMLLDYIKEKKQIAQSIERRIYYAE